MTYSFSQDIKDIHDFYKTGGGYLGMLGQIVSQLPLNQPLQNQVTQAVNTRSESFSFLMRKTIPIMLSLIHI
jgi:hypothetical protein